MKDDGAFDWRRWDYLLAALLMGAMAVIAFANIVGRELFGRSLDHVEEITTYLFVFSVIIGAGIAFERGSHLGMVTVYKLLPVKLRRVIIWVNACLGGALFLVVSLILIKTTYREVTVYKTLSQSLEIPKWIYYAIFLALVPSVFVGIYRGLKRALAELDAGDVHHD